jgi:hypothetical protein
MLSMNETFVSLNHRLSSVEDKRIFCVVNLELDVHMILILFIELFLFHLYTIISVICFVVLLRYPHWYRPVHAFIVNNWLAIFEEDERYSSQILLLKNELISTFVYLFFAFIYTQFKLLNSNSSVTSMIFGRWLIEASLAPLVLGAAVFEYYIEWNQNFFDQYHLYTAMVILVKVPLFILMRYNERHSDFFLNDLKVSFFKIFCKRF